MKFPRLYLGIVTLFSIPFIGYGKTVNAPKDFKGVVSLLTDIIGTLVILTFALTFLAFMWGIIKSWVMHGEDPSSIESGRNIVVTSVIALVIMVSIWGILTMLKRSLFG